MASADFPSVTDPGLGGGGNSIDWNDPINGPMLWEREGWHKGPSGLWYHQNYGTLGFITPPQTHSRSAPAPGGGGSGGNVPPGGDVLAPPPSLAANPATHSWWSNMPELLTKAAPLAAVLGRRAITGPSSPNTNTGQPPPELSALLAKALERVNYQDPLFRDVTDQARKSLGKR